MAYFGVIFFANIIYGGRGWSELFSEDGFGEYGFKQGTQ